MKHPFKNDKASRSLTAILAGADDEVVETPVNTEEVSEDVEEPEEVSEDGSEEVEDVEEPEEIEEITDEEVEAARKSAEEVEDEPEEVSEDDSFEPSEDDEEVEDEDAIEDDEEPEELVEITDEEVEAARKSMEEVSEDEDEDDIEDDEEPEEVSVEDAMDEESNNEEVVDEPVDEEACTEAVACLVKNGFTCSIDEMGKIAVTACGEQCAEPEEVESCEKESVVTIRPVDASEKVEACDVCCVLNGEGSEKPFYTILIKGIPVATICLEDQPNAEAIRNYFLSNDYPRKLASAMAVSGVKDVLDTQKARMFAAAASKSDMAQSMKAEAKAEFDKQIAEAVIAAKDKFINAVKLAVAGMNKNFFQEDNNLKAATYAAFTELGCNADVAVDKVNKVFAEAESFFDTAIAKAQELMGKSDEAFAEVAEMVANAGIASRPAKTFASALESGNNPIIAGVQKSAEEKATAAAVQSKIKAMRLFH